MPRYDYRCNDCGEQFEMVQSFDEPALTTCPHCGQEGLRKLFGNVGVVFKGSGFYRNDSRESGKKSSAATGESSTSKSESGSGDASTSSAGDKSSSKAATSSTKADGSKSAAAKSSSGSGAGTAS